jgi:hypothetical protein
MSDTKQEGEAKCGLCGSADLMLDENVGWDVDEGGEENQHEEHCRKCGASRFVFDRYDLFGKETRCYGSWHKKEG